MTRKDRDTNENSKLILVANPNKRTTNSMKRNSNLIGKDGKLITKEALKKRTPRVELRNNSYSAQYQQREILEHNAA